MPHDREAGSKDPGRIPPQATSDESKADAWVVPLHIQYRKGYFCNAVTDRSSWKKPDVVAYKE